jgi:hypothetical protein
MAVTADIVATYREPGQVMQRLLAMGRREDRALAILMAFCAVAFIAQLPGLSRAAHLTGQDLNPMMGGALMGTVFILPLLLYLLAGLSHLVVRLFGGQGSGYGARLALFWSLLATSPLVLLHGLVAGFIGTGTGLTAVGLIWLAVFLWFWFTCLRQAERYGE